MSLPLYLRGKHLTSVVLTPVTVGTAGAVTDVTASAATLTTVMDSLALELSANLEEISAVNATRQNNVVLDDGHRLSLSILEVNNAADPSPLAALMFTHDYFKAVYVKGTGASARTITGYFHRENYNDGIQGKGRQIATLTLAPVDLGTASITRA